MSVTTPIAPTIDEAAFVRQAHSIVRDLMTHRAWVYWCDFLGSMTLAGAGLYFYLSSPVFSLPAIGGFFLASFLLYRASVFTHELAHMPPTRYRVFRFVWNVLFGIPFLMPTYFYTDHRVHHVKQIYGTPGDGEYFPLVKWPAWRIILHTFVVFVVPIMLIVRFTAFSIASVLSPRVRRWTWQKASSLGNFSPQYYREAPDADERWAWLWQETGCFVWITSLITLTALGIIPWQAMAKIYFMYVFVMFVNQLRIYAAHHYGNQSEPMTFVEQMLDSTTIHAGPWSALWAPLGMRYHALHHLFPTMPYHAMGRAHRRLLRELPANSIYHATVRPSLFAAIGGLFRASREYRERQASPA